MELLLYTIIVFFATAIGATSGVGGGAIIKPLFDLIGIDNATVIGTYSTIAVFTMCLTSIYKHVKTGVSFDKKILYGLSIGSIVGGIIGDMIFTSLTQTIPNHSVIFIQSILLFFVLLAVLFYTLFSEQFPKYQLRHLPVILIVGGVVGALSVFLGIGGGHYPRWYAIFFHKGICSLFYRNDFLCSNSQSHETSSICTRGEY